jgi:hypothetical protein
MRKSVSWLVTLAVVTVAVVIVGVQYIHGRVSDGLTPAPAGMVLAGLGPVPTAGAATVKADFTTLPDGPVPERIGGRFFRTIEFGSKSAPAAVVHGGLTHGDPTGPNAASFAQTLLGNPIHRLGASVRFPDDLGDIALVAWQVPLGSDEAKGQIPNAGIHFVASAVQWHMSVWDSSVQHEIVFASGTYTRAGNPGDPRSFEISRSGDTATVHLPDGTERTVTDPRIGAWSADNACWELYEYGPGERPAVITALWSD